MERWQKGRGKQRIEGRERGNVRRARRKEQGPRSKPQGIWDKGAESRHQEDGRAVQGAGRSNKGAGSREQARRNKEQ